MFVTLEGRYSQHPEIGSKAEHQSARRIHDQSFRPFSCRTPAGRKSADGEDALGSYISVAGPSAEWHRRGRLCYLTATEDRWLTHCEGEGLPPVEVTVLRGG
jgi:hypothetical protein